MHKINYKQKKITSNGFSLIETLVYIFITALLLVTISSLVLTNFNIRKQLKTSDLIYNDARFIISQLNNKIHTVSVFEDLRPDPEQIQFYYNDGPDFVFIVEDENLIFREINVGVPTGTEYILNTDQVMVSNFTLTPVADWQDNTNKGVLINFTLTTGNPANIYGYLSENFQTFITLR